MAQSSDESDEDSKPSTSDEEDPVVREYDVFITPKRAQKLMLLQYPNRDRTQPYSEANHAKALGMRIKPKSGLVEVDVPMNVNTNYDKEKGITWGEAMRKSTMEKGGGSHGFAGGFGVGGGGGGGVGRRGGRANEIDDRSASREMSQDALITNFEDANNKGRVLNKQTLGGLISPVEDGQPLYMVGAFRGNELHLSRVDSMVQLRPQFHHIDATVEQERSSARVQRDATNPARHTEARAVQMTVKSSDGDDIDMGETSKTLRAAQEEKWTTLKYMDEDVSYTHYLFSCLLLTDEEKSIDSWDMYHEKLFLSDTENAPKLQANMTNREYLDAISAPRIDSTGTAKKPVTVKSEPDVGAHRDGKPDVDMIG
ncbi:MAG: hypothetical protein M1827_002322 [Pycnora praestabilis]|nr:MAG: hypothetical protein M1827_002322 [Pycnora praestabilis]